MCCGITYLAFGVMNSNLSFSPVKPRILLTEHTVLALDSDSLSKVQNINYTLGGQTENEIDVNCQLNYTGIPDCRKKQIVMDLYVMKNAQDTTYPQPDFLASFSSNIWFSVLTVLCKTNRNQIQ